jgi:CubicO group peptidase (beta-lactamase class C family)
MRALVVFWLIALSLGTAPKSAAAEPGDTVAVIANAAIAQAPLPGLSVAVLRDDDLAYAGGFGMAEIDNRVAATAATVYRINSITKAFTAIAVLQLAEAGKLRLDDRLSQYFAEFTRPGHDPTLAQLLNHSAGLVDYHGTSFHQNIRLGLTARQWVESVNDEHLYTSTPGTGWRYSNAGYDIAGLVVAKVAGMPFSDYLQEHVFAAAGMRATGLCNTRAVVPDRAFSYERVNDRWTHAESWGTYGDASGRVCSSVQDLAAFWIALQTGRLLAPASLRAMRTPGRLATGTPFSSGLGTRLGALDGHPLVGHTGSGEMWSSALVALPDRRLTVIVLANSDSTAQSASRIATEIVRRVAALPEPAAHDHAVERALMKQLSGTWGSDERADISAEGRHLRLKPVGAPIAPIALTYLGRGSFRFPPDPSQSDIELQFDTRHEPYSVQIFRDGLFQQLQAKQLP